MNLIYNVCKEKILKDLNFSSDTFKIALISEDYSPNEEDNYFSDISSYEIDGLGYTQGGETLFGVNIDNDGNTFYVNASNVTWATSTITARAAVIYKYTGDESTSPLIAYYDFGSNKTSVIGNFIINFSLLGFLTITS